MGILKRIAKENRKQLVTLAIVSLIGGGLNASFLVLITKVLSLEGGVEKYGWLAFVLICGFTLYVRHYHRTFAVKVAMRISNALRIRMADLIKSCSAEYRNKGSKADLLVIVTQDVQTISQFILAIPTLLSNLALVLGAAFYIIYISEASLYMAMIASIAAGGIVYFRIMSRTTPLFRKIRAQQRKFLGYFDDLINGYKELKTKPRYGELIRDRHIKCATIEMADLQVKAASKHSHSMNITQFLIYFLIGYILFVYPNLADTAFDTSTMVTYVVVVLFAAAPFETILGIFPQFKHAGVSAKRISQLEQELVEHNEFSGKKESGQGVFDDLKELNLVNVAYQYNTNSSGKRFSIGPINITIRKGEVLLIAGKNGSGKSTLSKIINGLYSASRGDVYWNEHKLVSEDILTYRSHYATVFSDYHLFEETFNVYDLEKHKDSEWLDVLEIKSIVLELLENRIRSSEMSQGQKRRLAIFVMLLENRPVYIFDEPGADLDPDFKDVFYYRIVRKLRSQGKTIIIVSHDSHYFNIADRVIEMANGKVKSDRVCDSVFSTEELVGA
ncbi:MAG: cyclic peptide export ABC transporter [Gammaproteobacteria bacterium]|nr:cyclic peptide export ABC transporter [Gammaproteobacteria bacterium]